MRRKRGSWCTKRDSFSSSFSVPSRRGQITIFIIAGIALLFAFAGFLYVTKVVSKEPLTTSAEPIIEEVPLEFRPLQAFTENCLRQESEKGLILLGQQGGYIYPRTLGEFSISEPTESQGINLGSAAGGITVPYWHFNREPNAGKKVIYSSWQPKLFAADDPEMSIEAQMERFVEERIPGCLDNYSRFGQEGFRVVVSKQPEAELRIGEETVGLLLKYPLQVKKGEAEQEMEQFYVKFPLRLKHYYDVASEIADTERKFHFLERHTLDAINTYGAVDVDAIPPTEALTFDLVPTASWQTAEVKGDIKNMLVSHVPLLRYLGSSNFYRYDYPPSQNAVLDLRDLYQKHYDNAILPLELGQDIEVGFDYFGWEPYLHVNDQRGQIVPGRMVVNYMMLQFASNHYYTAYDLSFPVLVSIRDPAALGGRGYDLTFALEANVRNNNYPDDGYVEPAPIGSTQRSLACDNSTWSTDVLRTVVVDSATRDPLQAVQIGFSIPNLDDCTLGVTDEEGEFDSKYPAVYGGVGSYIKPGYLSAFYPLDTYDLGSEGNTINGNTIIGYAVAGSEPVVQLHPLKMINISVQKKELYKCIDEQCFGKGAGASGKALLSYIPTFEEEAHRWYFSPASRPLAADESATVVLKRVADIQPGVYNDPLVAAATMKGTERGEVQLAPGKYEVTIMVQRDKPLVIPADERCTGGVVEAVACFDLAGCCFTFDEVRTEKMIMGQVAWDTEESYLTITPEQLYGSQEIRFSALAMDWDSLPVVGSSSEGTGAGAAAAGALGVGGLFYGAVAASVADVGISSQPRVLEDITAMTELANQSKVARQQLQPEFR